MVVNLVKTGQDCCVGLRSDIFLIHGRVGTTLDERIDPAKGDPLDDGDIVFQGIFDKLGTYVQVNDTGQGNSVTLRMSCLSM